MSNQEFYPNPNDDDVGIPREQFEELLNELRYVKREREREREREKEKERERMCVCVCLFIYLLLFIVFHSFFFRTTPELTESLVSSFNKLSFKQLQTINGLLDNVESSVRKKKKKKKEKMENMFE